MESLLESERRSQDMPSAFSRSARLALAGLIAAPALLALASAAGVPVRAGVETLHWSASLAGFAGSGWLAGRRLGLDRRHALRLGAAFLLTGMLVAPAFRALQGLTGREPVGAVAGMTLGAFCAGFILGGAAGAWALGRSRLGARGVAGCAAAGSLGGALALLPYGWSLLRLHVPGESYLLMALAVAGFLGCVIVPFHIVGLVLERVPLRLPGHPAYASKAGARLRRKRNGTHGRTR